MSARAAILAALADGPRATPERIAAEARALLVGVERPATPGDDLAAEFIAKLSVPSIGATYGAVADWRALPAAVAACLDAQGDGRGVYLPPDPRLDSLDWSGVDRLATIAVDGAAGLAIAIAGVAETGSLILDTGPHAPMLPNFLALLHIVVLERAALVRFLDDVLPPAAQPRARYWITGVSGTTDIEGQYVRGAHGPRFLHVILIG